MSAVRDLVAGEVALAPGESEGHRLLRRWLAAKNHDGTQRTAKALALRLGALPSRISMLVCGATRYPSLPLAAALERTINIPIRSWMQRATKSNPLEPKSNSLDRA